MEYIYHCDIAHFVAEEKKQNSADSVNSVSG
jgi:hypothetical protein